MKGVVEESEPRSYIEITTHGSEYDILNRHTGVHGLVWVTTSSLECFREGSHLWDVLIRDHKESEEVAEIQQFYPHGDEEGDTPSIEINQGVGTYVLDHVLTDLVNRGIRIIYSFNPSDCFCRRLKKQGFKELDPKCPREMYKVCT